MNTAAYHLNGNLHITWHHYHTERCGCHRDALTLNYVPLVQRVAGKFWRKVPSQVELDDLISYGMLGLIRAIEHYDPFGKVTFETYAVPSIRGVILDELRTLDWAPRSLRRNQRALDKARDELEALLGREPTLEEIAKKADVPISDVMTTENATDQAKPKSLDEGDNDEEYSRYEHIEDQGSPDPSTLPTELLRMASDLITQMPVQDQAVIALYYYRGETLAEVGRELGIPESRASQIHTRVIVQVREHLASVLA